MSVNMKLQNVLKFNMYINMHTLNQKSFSDLHIPA